MSQDTSHGVPESKFCIVLFGKGSKKNVIGNMILKHRNAFSGWPTCCAVGESQRFAVVNTPDFYSEQCLFPDQQIIDCMALSYPGPHLFILDVIKPENAVQQIMVEKEVMMQVNRLKETFGQEISRNLVVMLPDIQCLHDLDYLEEKFKIKLSIPNENLSDECWKWCKESPRFLYAYQKYSLEVVKGRWEALNRKRRDATSDQHGNITVEVNNGESLIYTDFSTGGGNADELKGCAPRPSVKKPEQRQDSQISAESAAQQLRSGDTPGDSGTSNKVFNIVLLGQTGTGKSSSGNTILTAADPKLDPKYHFISTPSSMPVTRLCDVRVMLGFFGTQVNIVDTPDFFNDDVQYSDAIIKACKQYCQKGRCVLLYVIQLGRFTEAERDTLERLEQALGWAIRESTIVLLTHGEDLKGKTLKEFVEQDPHLRRVVELCGNRYHLFNNNSKHSKQAIGLIKKIPNYKELFPKCEIKTDPCKSM